MILDKGTLFGDNKALNTGGAGTYLLSDVIDLGNAPTGRDIGAGSPGLWFVAQVAVAATSGGSATLQLILAGDNGAAIPTDGSAAAFFTTAAIPVATLVAGYRICCVRLPSAAYKRYLGVLQVTAVAAFTAGKLDMFLTQQPTNWKAYPDAAN